MRNMLVILLGIVLFTATAQAEGDATKGERVAKKCIACHSFKEPVNKTGPHLRGIVGRAIGAMEGYKYSAAFATFGATNGVWDEAKLDQYLADPKGFIKGNKMALPPLKRPEERADLIAYLKTLTEP